MGEATASLPDVVQIRKNEPIFPIPRTVVNALTVSDSYGFLFSIRSKRWDLSSTSTTHEMLISGILGSGSIPNGRVNGMSMNT